MAVYEIRSGLFNTPQILTLHKDFAEYDVRRRSGKAVRLGKEDISDFRHGMDWIRWYRFVVGKRFSISFKDREGQELRVVFRSYFGLNKHYDQLYADIVNDIWSLYHQDKVDRYLAMIRAGQQVILKGVTLARDGISFPKASLVPWARVGISEYYDYFALFDRDDPQVHFRISYNEYETELLWSIAKACVR